MNSHKVETIASRIRARDLSNNRVAKYIDYILIKPPIHVGEGFSEVVLGRDHTDAALYEVYSDSDVTLLAAEVDEMGSGEDLEIMALNTIRERISTLVNDPSKASVMAEQLGIRPELYI